MISNDRMANLIRNSKSGSDWTVNDLLAYNIRVERQDFATFFGIPNPPAPNIDDEVLTAPDAATAQGDDPYTFLRTMDLAMNIAPGEESAVVDFASVLFRMLGYTGKAVGRVSRTRKDILFMVCGEERHAKTDVCIIDNSDVLLLVQEDKRHLDQPDPEPQLIAEAIAAFSHNNRTRVRLLGRPPLEQKIILGITMMGTMPTFYMIPVTAQLVLAVQLGEYPERETVVVAHSPQIPRPERRLREGMQPLDNRRFILSCYQAFREFL